jgi:hypothetical protein
MVEPQTRYAKTVDGVHIAYQARGAGPADIVWIPTFVSNFLRDLRPMVVRRIAPQPRLLAVVQGIGRRSAGKAHDERARRSPRTTSAAASAMSASPLSWLHHLHHLVLA